MLDDVKPSRPSKDELEAARGRTIDAVLAPGLDVVFVGINPGLWSGATGHHFAGPNNRFWRALEGSRFTDRVLGSWEDTDLPRYRLGVTNLVPRTTAKAAELTDDEYRAGAAALREKLEPFHPRRVAFLGIEAYGKAFSRPNPTIGKQKERLGDVEVWVLPNPSGANAYYSLEKQVALFTKLRASLE
jgi:TDG/mug DNA glycosylase family protein